MQYDHPDTANVLKNLFDGRAVSLADIENPYRGLRAFEETNAADFFGRETLVERLIGRLAEDGPYNRFLAVVGPSGSSM